MNVNSLNITIEDFYNVIDTEGNLEGYSLGYFVDGEPYGYAIYSIEDNEIMEFSFGKGIKNIYLSLCEQAKNIFEENNRFIDAVIYEGSIEYSVLDLEGNKLSIDGSISEEEPVVVDTLKKSEYNDDTIYR